MSPYFRQHVFARVAMLSFLVTARTAIPASPTAPETDYPRKTIALICPWSPGGGTDRVSRFFADALSRELGQPVIVINKTGGSGAIGHTAGARARADGYTLTMITFELSTMHRMGITDLTHEEFACVMQVNGDAAGILVASDAPWNDLSEFLAAAAANPGQLKMSGTATGGAWDLARVGLQMAANVPVDSIVWVPTKGAAPSLKELLGGHIDAVCCSVPEAASQIEAGQLRLLAVMSEQRHPDFPDAPTASELGVSWVALGWRGLAMPKGTPPEIVNLVARKCRRIAESDEYNQFMAKNGFGIILRSPEEFRRFLRRQDDQWRDVVQVAGYGEMRNGDPGPMFFPGVLVALLGLCGVVCWTSGKRSNGVDSLGTAAPVGGDFTEAPLDWTRVALLAFGVTAYIVGLVWLGFSLSTLAFAVGMMRWLGTRWPLAFIVALAMTVTIRLLFVGVFRLQLPAGELGLPF